MVLCECACANLISKVSFNLLDRIDLFIRLHIIFQISFQSYKGQKSYRKFWGVRSELLLGIYGVDQAFFGIFFSYFYNKRCRSSAQLISTFVLAT